MRPRSLVRQFFTVCVAVLWMASPASAADVHVMISAGFYAVYSELGPAFERASGHHLITARGPSLGDSPEAIPTRLARGEAADVVILDGASADELARRGLVQAGSKILLARSQVGMVVRAGAAKPDIRSVEDFRKVLLAVKSIAYSDSASGIYLSTVLFAKLGVADQVAGKSRKVRGPPSGEPVAAVVARGEAEIGFQQVSELINVPGVTFVGTIPAELQPDVSFAGALTSTARQPDAARALIRFLASPEAAATISKAGLTPISGEQTDLRVVATFGIQGAMEKLLPEYKRVSGQNVSIEYEESAVIQQRVASGKVFDVAILVPQVIEDLIKSGQIKAGTRTDLAKTSLGIGVRSGTPRRDIRTPEAVKETLLSARSIIFSKVGSATPVIDKMIQRLGITGAIDTKIVRADQGRPADAVGAGKIDLVIAPAGAIVSVPGVDFLGLLPAEFQTSVVLTAGIGTRSERPDRARALIEFIIGSKGAAILRASGMEPVAQAPAKSNPASIKKVWKIPRTLDGQPDLQGVWANNNATPLERPTVLAGRATLTDEEVAALKKKAGELFNGDGDAAFGDEIFRSVLESVKAAQSVPYRKAPDYGSDLGTGSINFWQACRNARAVSSTSVSAFISWSSLTCIYMSSL